MNYGNIKPIIREIMKTETRNNSLKPQYWFPLAIATYDEDEVMEAIESMCTFRTTMWDKTQRFEEAFGELHDAEAIMVNSGSSADLLSSFLLHERSGGQLKTGDEVLVSAVTWPTQVWSLSMAGFVPRFVDVNPNTLNIDLQDLRRQINPRTKALALVHLMGNSSPMSEIKGICDQNGMALIEDCCESLLTESDGQKVGTFGESGTFSFFFSHQITTMEGGMIITRNLDHAERLRLLRAHGWSRNLKAKTANTSGIDERYTFLSWGFNVRPTELQAGFGLIQLARLPQFMAAREKNAAYLMDTINQFQTTLRPMLVNQDVKCSWFTFPILVNKDAPFSRNDLTSFLENNGVETRPIVAGNLSRQPAIEKFPELQRDDLPGADEVHDCGFYIGIHPVDYAAEICRFSDLLTEFHSTR